MTDNPRNGSPRWVDSGSGPGWNEPEHRTAEPVGPPPRFPRLRTLRGIFPPVPGDRAEPVPVHVEVDALKTILERHATGADGVCCCGERAGEFTGRCAIGRKAAVRLAALGFAGRDVPQPGWRHP